MDEATKSHVIDLLELAAAQIAASDPRLREAITAGRRPRKMDIARARALNKIGEALEAIEKGAIEPQLPRIVK